MYGEWRKCSRALHSETEGPAGPPSSVHLNDDENKIGASRCSQAGSIPSPAKLIRSREMYKSEHKFQAGPGEGFARVPSTPEQHPSL
jgi:hypothetical protein